MQIQNIYKCKYYTNNENMNKTCQNKYMCKIYYEIECFDYKEKEDERDDFRDNPNRTGINDDRNK